MTEFVFCYFLLMNLLLKFLFIFIIRLHWGIWNCWWPQKWQNCCQSYRQVKQSKFKPKFLENCYPVLSAIFCLNKFIKLVNTLLDFFVVLGKMLHQISPLKHINKLCEILNIYNEKTFHPVQKINGPCSLWCQSRAVLLTTATWVWSQCWQCLYVEACSDTWVFLVYSGVLSHHWPPFANIYKTKEI